MFYQSLQHMNNQIIFRVAARFRLLVTIKKKNCLKGINKNTANYFKDHEAAACCHPISTILQSEKSLQR